MSLENTQRLLVGTGPGGGPLPPSHVQHHMKVPDPGSHTYPPQPPPPPPPPGKGPGFGGGWVGGGGTTTANANWRVPMNVLSVTVIVMLYVPSVAGAAIACEKFPLMSVCTFPYTQGPPAFEGELMAIETDPPITT